MVYKISPSGGPAKNGTRCAALLGDEDVLSFRGSCFILLSSIVINLCFTFRWCSKALLRNSNKGHKTFCYNRLKSKIKILFFFFFPFSFFLLSVVRLFSCFALSFVQKSKENILVCPLGTSQRNWERCGTTPLQMINSLTKKRLPNWRRNMRR